MKINFFLIIALIMMPAVAVANLRVTASSTLGSQCYSESTAMHVGKCILSESAPLGIRQCPQNWADVDSGDGTERHCYLANQGTTITICSTDIVGTDSDLNGTACEEIFPLDTYTDIGGNRVMSKYVGGSFYDFAPWTGYITVNQYDSGYGCTENYYPSNGKLDASIVCGACPENGKSSYFNTAITGCYIPAYTDFSNETGKGTYTADCYYK